MEIGPYFNFSSEDFGEFAAMIKNGDVRQHLLDQGSFKGQIQLIQTQNMILSSFSMSRKILQQGRSSSGFITFLIWNVDSDASLYWKFHKMDNSSLPVVWQKEHHSITEAGFNGLPVSFNENFLKQYCSENNKRHLVKMLEVQQLFKVDEVKLSQIRNKIKHIFSSDPEKLSIQEIKSQS